MINNLKQSIYEFYESMSDEEFNQHIHGCGPRGIDAITNALDEFDQFNTITMSELEIIENYEQALIYQRLLDLKIQELIDTAKANIGEDNLWSDFGQAIKTLLQKERYYKEN
jgi:hypothetical protein